MSLLHIDGFESFDTVSRMARRGWTLVGTPVLSTTARTGTRSFQGDTNWGGYWNLGAANEHATVIVGVAYNPGAGTVVADIVRFLSDTRATLHVTVTRLTDGNVQITAGGSVRATSTGAPLASPNQYYYVEVKAVLSDTTGSVEVRLNGSTTAAVTWSGDTKNGGTKTVFDSIGLIGPNGSPKWDDLYVCNGAGAAPHNDFMGEVRVWPLLPNGDGTYSQFDGSDGNSTNNSLLVDEAATALNAADYVESDVNGEKDSYALENLSVTSGLVVGVAVNGYMMKSDAGAKDARQIIRTGSTDFGGADQALSVSNDLYSDLWPTNPNTSTTWTVSEVNGLEAGVEVRS